MKKIRYKTLGNGLRIVGEEIDYVRSVSLGVWFNVGSRLEGDDNMGIAHFIEHMMFKGTSNRTAREISNSIDYYGGDLNAFTDHDSTCYYVKMPYNHIDRGIDVLSDILTNSLFSEKDIEKEKSVITEEIRMYEDSTEDYLYEQLMKLTYDNKGIGRNVLGTIESIESLNREKIIDFFEKYYRPNNAVVCISGRFDFDKITDIIEKSFAKWEKSDVDIRRNTQNFVPKMFIEDKDDEQANIAILFKSPTDKDDLDFFSVKLINNILGSTTSSRLFQHIREDRALAYSIYSSASFYVDWAQLGIFASVAPENIKRVYDMILCEIDNLKNEYITEDELVFAKEQYKGTVLMDVEDTEDKMQLIGEYEVDNRRIRSTDEVLQIVDSIDMEKIKEVIDRIFSTPMSVGITGRDAKKIMNMR